MNTKIIFYIAMAILPALFNQCKDRQNPVPATSVNITINMNDASFNDLVPGSYKYITGGINGIILYRRTFDDFSALERMCPHEAEYGTRVSVDPDNELFLECDTCQSRFYIEDGALTQGPSNYPLRSYKTMFDGQILKIYN